uniref:Putative LOC100213065 [Hydra vulgaris] n=1 Tax=Lepeophtheirus salmonis TaxID=72036 RepID=A0A0K2V5S0_LEPSM
MQQLFELNFSDFWIHDLWPPSSPDINPLDYCYVERRACSIPHPYIGMLQTSS